MVFLIVATKNCAKTSYSEPRRVIGLSNRLKQGKQTYPKWVKDGVEKGEEFDMWQLNGRSRRVFLERKWEIVKFAQYGVLLFHCSQCRCTAVSMCWR